MDILFCYICYITPTLKLYERIKGIDTSINNMQYLYCKQCILPLIRCAEAYGNKTTTEILPISNKSGYAWLNRPAGVLGTHVLSQKD